MRVERITLEGERPQSWNVLKRAHWTRWQREVGRCALLVRAQAGAAEMFTGPVHITVLAHFDSRPLDASNVPAKLYEDGLKGTYLRDDNPNFVTSMTTISLIDKAEPRVEIIIEEAGE